MKKFRGIYLIEMLWCQILVFIITIPKIGLPMSSEKKLYCVAALCFAAVGITIINLIDYHRSDKKK